MPYMVVEASWVAEEPVVEVLTMGKRMKRREFIKFGALTAAGVAVAACAKGPSATLSGEPTPAPSAVPEPTEAEPAPTATPELIQPSLTPATAQASTLGYFSLHPFIEAHPEAVFILRTRVADKADSEAKKSAGLELAKGIFTLSDAPGIPLTHKIAIKPNLTCTSGHGNTPEGMGIVTDKYFMEGLIEGLKGLGVPAGNMTMREGNWLGEGYCPNDIQASGYVEMAERMGAHLVDFPTGRKISEMKLSTLQEGTEVIWKDCPEGVVFRRIGYVAPFNAEDSWLLDVAKLKAHGMGMTLSVKNLQGMCISPYVRFCEGVENTLKHPASIFKDFQPDLAEHVADLHKKHLEAGIPRWDRPGKDWNSGYGMEMWAQRTCDSHSVTKVGLCIIEGIYGRNGNAFMEGPGPGGKAEDFMTNVLIFGKNPFRVDIIGNWLAGHEPGSFGLFHIARERGLVDVLNPMEIPVYLWEGENPKLTPLTDFERVPLKTYYLQKNYGGQNEPLYHMVDEPFDYSRFAAQAKAQPSRSVREPGLSLLGRMNPGLAQEAGIIEYRLAEDAYVRLEACDAAGRVVGVLADGPATRGVHMASFNAREGFSGVCYCRYRVGGFEERLEV